MTSYLIKTTLTCVHGLMSRESNLAQELQHAARQLTAQIFLKKPLDE
jgi:hypothetical protein